MSRIFLLALPVLLLVLQSCGNREQAPAAAGPHATVQLRDGSVLTGTVVASSPRQLVLAGDDKATRTLEMNQVKSVQYDEPPAEAVEHRPDTGAPGNPPATKPEPAPAQSKATPPPSPPQPNAQERPHPEESIIRTRTYELAAGTPLAVRTDERIDSAKAVEGQTFAAEISRDVLDTAGELVIPHGANAQIVIRSAARGGRFKGASDLVLDLKSVSIGGRMYLLDTVDMVRKGKEGIGANKRTAEYSGAGAAIGAIIGAIAGGGKGAAIGAGAGAGAGVIGQVVTKGGSIQIPPESILTFQLEKPLKVVAAQ